MERDIDALQQERARLFREISELGDFRRGSISETYRRCGKTNCCCADEGHCGHGPQYLLMTKVGGRSHAKYLKPGAQLTRLQAEVRTHLRFREIIQKIVEVSEEMCDKRATASPEKSDTAALKKTSRKSSRKRLRAR